MIRIRRFIDIIRKPYRTMQGMAPDWLDVGVILGLLAVLNIGLALLQTSWSDETIRWIDLVGGLLLGLAAAWLGLSVLLYAISYYLKGYGNFWKFIQYMGYAAAPFLLTTTISLILMLLIRLFDIGGGLSIWIQINRVLGVIGMLWGWPGYLSLSAVRVVLFLPKTRTIYLFIGVWIFLIIGWLLPIVVPLLSQ